VRPNKVGKALLLTDKCCEHGCLRVLPLGDTLVARHSFLAKSKAQQAEFLLSSCVGAPNWVAWWFVFLLAATIEPQL
jgi:hypothetical protein